MKYKDEDPDNLGGLGDMLPADVLQKVNELLEQLHWTDHTNQGSKIEFVYVASGGQHVETQINIENPPKQPTTNPEKEQPLPNPLQKEREPRKRGNHDYPRCLLLRRRWKYGKRCRVLAMWMPITSRFSPVRSQPF